MWLKKQGLHFAHCKLEKNVFHYLFKWEIYQLNQLSAYSYINFKLYLKKKNQFISKKMMVLFEKYVWNIIQTFKHVCAGDNT